MTVRDDILAIPDEKLRNGLISSDYLVFMDFVGAPKHWWTGWGEVVADGQTWLGVGNLIGISDLPVSYSQSADKVTFTLAAATLEMMGIAQDESNRAYGRDVVIYEQLMDVTPDDAGKQPWTSIGAPYVVYSGVMGPLTFKASADPSTGDVSRTLMLEGEGIFTNRNAPANGRWSDADQRRRSPGDLGCDRMPIYENYSPTWTV